MKTQIHPTARFTGLAIALVLFAGVATEVKAGGDSKGAIRLLELSGRGQPAAAPAVSEYKAMTCPKCQDVLVAKADIDTRGLGARSLISAGVPTRNVASHLCDGCGVEWKITGHGKAKEAVASHKCTGCGA